MGNEQLKCEMKKCPRRIYSLLHDSFTFLISLFSFLILFSCSQENISADKLNFNSYSYHYRNIDSTEVYARRVLALSSIDDEQRAEGLNNLAFVSMARMNYSEADSLLGEVLSITDNQVELLVGYVQQMRLCQRRSRNREFYEYREKAVNALKRINEERDQLNEHQRRRLLYAESEMAIVTSTYYYYVGLERQSVEAIRQLNTDEVRHDTAQYLNYLYNVGAGGILTEGTPDAPRTLDSESAYIGLFGWLNEHAVIKDLTLEQVAIYTQSPGSAYLGGIAGRMSGSETEGNYHGTRIDGCSVTGTIHHTTAAGTTFVGGICGHVFKGSIINTMTDMNLSCFEKSGELAEVGGIAGLLNRGLVANCYALGDITGSGYRDTQYDIEGMACIGNIAAVDGGCIVNCYGEGDVEALEYSIDTGILAGWVTGIGKAYHCWYNESAKMTIDGRTVSPVDPFGEVVAGGVSDEYFFRFPGALTTKVDGYRAGSEAEAEKLAKNLNASFSAFPVDIEGLYGLAGNTLKNWTVAENHAVFGNEKMEVTYVQPEVEKAVQEEGTAALKDGSWYGRSEDKSTIVRITVQDGAVVDTEAETGLASGDNYEQAEARARFKALYGDTTDYAPADTSVFKGRGTEASPYLIENEAQLRYLAASINEDTDWYGTWFRQTQDITVSGEEWKPIGWGIFADADNDGFGQDVVALYPFRGHFDGGNHTIRGLKAGSAETPSTGHYLGLFGIIQGDYTGNEIPQDAAVAELKNIHLENVEFHTENRWRSYIGGLVGNAQGGFSIRHCSVDGGTISSRSTEDFAFAGGLAGSLMYGCVADSWTDVDLTAYSGKNYSYADSSRLQ